jgi:membrane-associated phospholipid phosphatase
MLKKIPKWGWAVGIVYFFGQYGIYRLANWLSVVTGTISWAIDPKVPFIDDLFPIIPVFAVPYLYSYVFWLMAPAVVSLTDRRHFINYIYGLSLAYLIGFLIFVFMPTYMDRVAEGLMNYMNRPGIFNKLLNIIYSADGMEKAFNLFPSYHCLISAYCYIGVRRQEAIPKSYRVYSLVMFILIVLSTLFTKQHYILDSIGGIAIAYGCDALMNKLDPGKKYAVEGQ